MNQTSTTAPLTRAVLKDRAKGALSGKYGIFITACLTINLITFIVQNIASFLAIFLINPFFPTWVPAVEYVFLAITQVFLTVFKVGLALFALNIACGQSVTLSDIFYGYSNQFDKSLKISTVFVLMSQLTQLPATIISSLNPQKAAFSPEYILPLVLILLVCSTIYILLYLGFSQVYFLMLDFPDYSAVQLIKLSFYIMKGHKKRLLLLELSFLPLIFLTLLTLGIGDLWLTPYMQLTYAFFFLNLMQGRSTVSSVPDNTASPTES